MVKIAVFDVPATEGGAIGILNEYYDRAINDTETDWLFVVSIDTLQPRDNIKIIKLPWIKKSWLHRIYFELFIAHRIVRENNIDKILSLHNLVIPFAKVTNEVYFHQALIFSDIRYSIIKNLKLWVYQNVLSILFVRSLKHASRVIVQTHFLAQILNVGLGIPLSKITIKSPTLRPEVKHIHYSSKNIRSRPLQFIYPAAPYDYKCHQDIIDALKLMNANELENINIKFTFTGQENHNAERLRREINEYHLPVDLVGYIDYKEMIKQYEYSALLFTSSIESYGIPLLEARTTGAPVIASATVFAREILSGYRNACYYEPGSPHSLAAALSDYIASKKILESQKVYEFSQLLFIGGMYGEGYETDYLENNTNNTYYLPLLQ